jgi:cytochrome b561
MNRNRIAVWLDPILLLLTCSLMVTSFTGVPWHEWLSIGLAILLLLHLLLQWPWIANRARRLAKPGQWRNRINYAINFGLFASMVATMQSGLVISRVAMPAFFPDWTGDRRWGAIHGYASSVLVIMVGLHIAMNWDWIRNEARRLLRTRQ